MTATKLAKQEVTNDPPAAERWFTPRDRTRGRLVRAGVAAVCFAVAAYGFAKAETATIAETTENLQLAQLSVA